MDGWNEDKLYNLLRVLEDIYNLQYEVQNCTRGAYTGATTYSELADEIESLGYRLVEEASCIKELPEDEEEY